MIHVRPAVATPLLLSCVLGACAMESADPSGDRSTGSSSVPIAGGAAALCSFPAQPLISSVGTSADLIERFQAGTEYSIDVTGTARAFCVTLTLGGAFRTGSTLCLENVFSSPTSTLGTRDFPFTSNGGITVSGKVTPLDDCGAQLTQYTTSFSFRSATGGGGGGL